MDFIDAFLTIRRVDNSVPIAGQASGQDHPVDVVVLLLKVKQYKQTLRTTGHTSMTRTLSLAGVSGTTADAFVIDITVSDSAAGASAVTGDTAVAEFAARLDADLHL